MTGLDAEGLTMSMRAVFKLARKAMEISTLVLCSLRDGAACRQQGYGNEGNGLTEIVDK